MKKSKKISGCEKEMVSRSVVALWETNHRCLVALEEKMGVKK